MTPIIAIYGSPRRRGNTAALLQQAVAGARAAGARVTEIVLRDLKISPCLEIYGCKKNGRCVIKDDFQRLHDQLQACRGIMLASPIFFMNVSGQMKAFIDRFQCFWALRHVLKSSVPLPPGGEKRRAVFLSTAGFARTKFDCTLLTVRAFLSTIEARLIDTLCINGIDDKGEVSGHPEMLEQAYALGRRLASGMDAGDPS